MAISHENGHRCLHGALKPSVAAFSLVEMTLVILLIALLSAVTIPYVRESSNANKYEATREKMEKMRESIIGTEAVDNSGRRTQFGYVGDWGGLPSSLSDLTTAKAPAWTMNTAQSIGSGWRGPYLENAYLGPEGVTKDKWGFTFVYNTAANPPTMTSYGADNQAGGALYDKDLILEFSTTAWKSRVYGFVMDHNDAQSGKTVQIQYPVNGTLTTQSQISDAAGAFSFTQVPYGIRAVTVTGAPQIGPRVLVVESPYQIISGGLLNFFQRTQRVSYVAGSFSAAGSGGTVTVLLNNTYTTAKTVDYLTSWVDRQGTNTEGFLRRIAMGTTLQLIAAGVSSNTRVDVTVNMILPANSTNNTFQLSFTTTAGGSTARDMSTAQFNDKFEWVNGDDQDVISFP